ncbi:MAG: CxxC motif-containing protein (DUF1111 family) [Oleispira sp.]|jgi:CxxC motif-containing protein (DUF1111 family)
MIFSYPKLFQSNYFYILFAALFLSACDDEGRKTRLSTEQFSIPPYQKSEALPGGATSVSSQPFVSFMYPADNIDQNLRPLFYAGKALAKQPWVKAPTITFARDGLGPLYNARTCLACHANGGKGSIPTDSKSALFSTLVRLSSPGLASHPIYGDQLQTQSISLAHQLRSSVKEGTLKHDVSPEAYAYVTWTKKEFKYPDGNKVILRTPALTLDKLAYGEMATETQMSLRVAPAIQGMGLIELIKQVDIDKLSDEHDNNHDGISGRVNLVFDVQTQQVSPGRFGLKSNKPSLVMTIAGAFANDIGISNHLFPAQPCTEQQPTCNRAENGNDDEGVELPRHLLKLVVDFNRNLAPVKRLNSQQKTILEGRSLFYSTGCHACHNPSFITGKSDNFPHLSEQKIWPYSDFLLHDMGEELSDGRPDYLASGREWRTAPLWGLGFQKQVNGSNAYLHDGRATSVEQAILWHGGEAASTQSRFINLSKAERSALINFVESL